jgi:hypothetical protein
MPHDYNRATVSVDPGGAADLNLADLNRADLNRADLNRAD